MFGIGNKEDKESTVTTQDTATLDTSKEAVKADVKTTVTDSKKPVKVEVKTTVTDTPDVIETPIDIESDEPAPLTWKEAKALKQAKYADKIADNKKFKNIYVIRNKKTNQVVELRAASPVHAANIIGWRPRRIQVLDVRDANPVEEPETTGTSVE